MYRFVHTTTRDVEELARDFLPDRENLNLPRDPKDPTKPRAGRREKKFSDLLDGMSAFATEEAGRDRWAAMRETADLKGDAEVAAGNFIAEVDLVRDRGFEIEDLQEEDGHLTIWGDPRRLAEAVNRDPYPAERN